MPKTQQEHQPLPQAKRRRLNKEIFSNESLCIIFQFIGVDVDSVVRDCSLVCKCWQAVLRQEYMWREFCVNTWPSLKLITNSTSEQVQRNLDASHSAHFWHDLFKERYLRDHYMELELKRAVDNYSVGLLTDFNVVKKIVKRISQFRMARVRQYQFLNPIGQYLFDGIVYTTVRVSKESFHVEGKLYDTNLNLHSFSVDQRVFRIDHKQLPITNENEVAASVEQIRSLLELDSEQLKLSDLYEVLRRAVLPFDALEIIDDNIVSELFLKEEPLPAFSLVGNTLEVPPDQSFALTQTSLAFNQMESQTPMGMDLSDLSQRSQSDTQLDSFINFNS